MENKQNRSSQPQANSSQSVSNSSQSNQSFSGQSSQSNQPSASQYSQSSRSQSSQPTASSATGSSIGSQSSRTGSASGSSSASKIGGLDVNAVTSKLQEFGTTAMNKVNSLSTTQKVVGGSLLALGAGWLAMNSRNKTKNKSKLNTTKSNKFGRSSS